MPIFDQGYQHWDGKFSGHAWRWFTITRHGTRLQFKNRLTRIVMLMALMPAVALAAFLVAWGMLEKNPDVARTILSLFPVPQKALLNPQGFRTTFWTLGYDVFFQVELFFSMILVLLVGPNLISQDLRFNAIPLYFSRPLTRLDYFAGKLGVIGMTLAIVAIVPAIVAYVLGLCFSLDLAVIKDTIHLFFASIIYGFIIVLSAGTLMLALSSLSRNSRYVAMFWLAFWLVGNIVAGTLYAFTQLEWAPLLSYTNNLEQVGSALMDTQSARDQIKQAFNPGGPGGAGSDPSGMEWYWSAGVLAGLFGLSLWILSLRVKTLDRLK